MRYAIIKNNVVENTIVWDGVTPYTPPEGTILVASDTAEIGWIYNPETGDITPPTQP
jgi:hypothetical protein